MPKTRFALSWSHYAVLGIVVLPLLISIVFGINHLIVTGTYDLRLLGLIVFLIILFCSLVWDVYRNWQLRIDAEGVRRPGFVRPRFLPWDAVSDFFISPTQLVFYEASNQEWTIHLGAYRDPWSVITSCIEGIGIHYDATNGTLHTESQRLPTPSIETATFHHLGSIGGVGHAMRWMGGIFLLLTLLLGLIDPPNGAQAWRNVGGFVGMGMLIIGVGQWMNWVAQRERSGYHVRVTDTAIAEVRLGRPERLLQWEDIATVRYHPLNERLKLRSRRGAGHLAIDMDIAGLTSLLVIIHRKLQAVNAKP